ncbi:MAG: hypothetical protein H7X88_09430 [Gloeobacteraceae cyanobacterium ES-bin-316]|nr:hypothetical protein [Ferruginibacter sp.]
MGANDEHNKTINPDDLPQEGFKQKEVYQHKQPQDWGKPLEDDDQDKKDEEKLAGKEAVKSHKEEGLNEEKSEGEKGAFEGFEDHTS